jgi:hypothetical protein
VSGEVAIVLAGAGIGLLIGSFTWFPLGIARGKHLAEASRPKHTHDWSPWERLKITTSYNFMGSKLGEPSESDGQHRKCKSCGWEELAGLGNV